MSPFLASTLSRAASYTDAQGHLQVTVEHLLLALAEDPEATIVLKSSNIDIGRLTADVSTHLGRIEERATDGSAHAVTISADLKRILEAAAAAASQGRRREINGAIVLAAIVGEGRSVAAHILRAQGLTFEAVIKALQQAQAPPPPPAARASPQNATEDILASARERVQSRTGGGPALPSTPPLPHQPLPPPAPAPEGQFREVNGAPASQQMAPAPSLPAQHGHGTQSPNEDGLSSIRPIPREEARPLPAAPATPSIEPQWEPAALPPDPIHSAPPSPPPAPQPRAAPPAPTDYAPHQPPPVAVAPPPPPAPPQQWAPPSAPAPQPAPARAPARMPPPMPPLAIPGGAYPAGPQPSPPPTYTPQPQSAPPPGYRGPPSAPIAQPPWSESTAPPVAGLPPRPRGTAATANTPLGAPPRTGPPPQGALPPQTAEPRRRMQSAAVQAGQLVHNIPDKMRVEIPLVVEARIARAEVKAIADGLQGPGGIRRHEILVSKAMTVRLRAPDGGFTVETSSPETQWIDNVLGVMADDYASWRWTVTPRERGKRRLQLIISARTTGADGVMAETALPDQIVDVKVSINYARSASRWAGWIAAAVIGGVLARFGEDAYGLARAFMEKMGG